MEMNKLIQASVWVTSPVILSVAKDLRSEASLCPM